MKRMAQGTYVCTVCNAVVRAAGDERPQVVIAAHSGQPIVRIVTVAGEEVHRCVLHDGQRTVRL